MAVNLARAPRGEDLLTVRRLVAAAVYASALVICWRAAEIRPSALLDPASIQSVWTFIKGLFPPDLSLPFLRVVGAAASQTLGIALAGTALSIAVGLPLGVLATRSLWERGVLMAGEKTGAFTFMLSLMSRAARALLGFLRAVPDLMWGLLFVVAVGLGSLAGTLALGVSYCGVMGRVYADVFEDVDPRPLEALHATGATRAQVFLRAIWPQAAPASIAYTLYTFECCVRAASVLGFIGAGGIGYEINISMRLFDYGQVLTLILALVILVAATEAISRWLRARLHANAPPGSLAHQHLDDSPGLFRRLVREGETGISLLVFAAFAWSFYATGFFNGSLLDSQLLSRVSRFIRAMMPPDVDPAFILSLGVPLAQTIGISVMGTLLGIGIGAALSLPATSRLILHRDDAAGRHSRAERLARRLAYTSTRLALNGLRSIPELVWVLVCILAVGLGPFAGTLAIGLHTGGVLGKLYAETLEEAPERPLEALRASGARPLQILVWGILPQVRPTLVSYTVLRWEMNLRVSTVLGLVGGGGLGLAIYNNIQLGFYSRISTLIIVIYALVIATDWIGNRLRAYRTSI
ncbi:MAG TPA: ABC transporter permease subunit [Blastocatellia bacterium]|nr:ABC transporter permease subunit [Blastocatellia bacterium]